MAVADIAGLVGLAYLNGIDTIGCAVGGRGCVSAAPSAECAGVFLHTVLKRCALLDVDGRGDSATLGDAVCIKTRLRIGAVCRQRCIGCGGFKHVFEGAGQTCQIGGVEVACAVDNLRQLKHAVTTHATRGRVAVGDSVDQILRLRCCQSGGTGQGDCGHPGGYSNAVAHAVGRGGACVAVG